MTTPSTPRQPPADTPAGLRTSSTGFRSFLRLVSMLRPFRTRVIISAAIASAVVGARLFIPHFTGVIVDDIHADQVEDIPRHVVLLVTAATLMMVLNFGRRILAGTISLGLEQHLRNLLLHHLSNMGMRYHGRMQTGQLLSRVTSDVTQVRFFLGYSLVYFAMHITMLVSVPILMFRIAPGLAALVCLVIPLLFLVSVRYSRRAHDVLLEIQQREALITAAAEENIVGARVVRAFGQEDREIAAFRALVDDYVDAERRSLLIGARYWPYYRFIPNIALALIVLIGGSMVTNGSLSLGEFFSFFLYALMLTAPTRILGNLLNRAQRATASGQRLWELLDTDESLPVPSASRPLPERDDRGARIEFDDVSFAYRDNTHILDRVSLTIEPGSTVALLGPTGSGKSTLVSMVPRLYDPDGGRVLVDGMDLRDLDMHELRRTVGVVDQEPFLFSATVAENLRFGRPDADTNTLLAALDAAQAREFVEALPDGLDTMVGERGLTLSGGQRQRLSIARALVADPRILILDDATASVDSRVEARITAALDAARRGRTTLVIAHRPSTIALADRIVVLDAGRIVDDGTHDDLMQRSDLYRQVYEQRDVRREFLLDEVEERAVRERLNSGGDQP